MDVRLFDTYNIDALSWPKEERERRVRQYVQCFVKNGISTYIDNIQASSMAIKAGEVVLPVVVVESDSKSSWVCSTTTQYIDYGQEFTSLIDRPMIVEPVKVFLKGMRFLARKSDLNAAVYVNNSLFAVDLYPKALTQTHIREMTSCLRKQFPHHAIIFRSLNPIVNSQLLVDLKKEGFKLLASRHVHVTDTQDENIFKTRIIKSDLKLLREADIEVVDGRQLSSEDYEQIFALYRSLYIAQHSSKNPQINRHYIQAMVDQHLLEFKVVKKQGKIKGVAGYTEKDGVFLCPFFGYEKNDPDHNVIYRLLSTLLLLEAKERGVVFHQSAGASFYKSVRRAKGCFEYHAIYTKHLPLKQKMGWTVLRTFINTVAPPFMKKY